MSGIADDLTPKYHVKTEADSKLVISEILPDIYTRDDKIDLGFVYVISIPSHLGSKIVKYLATYNEGENRKIDNVYGHLKHIRKSVDVESLTSDNRESLPFDSGILDVIVSIDNNELSSCLSIFMSSHNLSPITKKVAVPLHPPVNVKQLKLANEIWPTTYRQPSFRPMIISDEFRSQLNTCFVKLLHVANDELSDKDLLLKDNYNFIKNNIPNQELFDRLCTSHVLESQDSTVNRLCALSCIITKRCQVVGVGMDTNSNEFGLFEKCNNDGMSNCHQRMTCRNNRNPLKHSVMIAIESVAKNVRLLAANFKFFHSGRQKVTHCDSKDAEMSQKMISENSKEMNCDDMCVESPTQQTSRNKHWRGIDNNQYLCTDLCAYVSSEPCVMCCMALVHSRISYLVMPDGQQFRNSLCGGLGGFVDLHDNKQLNHSFRIFCAKFS